MGVLMADFCKQCSIELFGEDTRDLAGLGYGLSLAPDEGFVVICEGCGYILVDEEGKCIDPFCDTHGEENKHEDSRSIDPS